jgi:peroxiredoxin
VRRIHFLSILLAVMCAAFVSRVMAVPEPGGGVAVGAKASDFTLQNYDGKNISLHDYTGKIVILEWVNSECPYVQRHYQAKTMQKLADQYKNDSVVWLSINSSNFITNEANKKWAADQSIGYPVLNDASGAVGKSYHATNTPQMFIISKDGTLLYKGAIDNDSEGTRGKDRVNYVQKAMGEILSGKTVGEPETKPYGCSVKYK